MLSLVAAAALSAAGQGPAMWALECVPEKPEQQWLLPGDKSLTDVQLASANASGLPGTGTYCWQIEGCFSTEGAKVGVDGGCKPLPVDGKCPLDAGGHACECNTAWQFHANGTITTPMDGHCLWVNHNSGAIIGTATCTGKPDQQFLVKQSSSKANGPVTITQLSSSKTELCVTACGSQPCTQPTPPPAPPPPGSCPTYHNQTACPSPPNCLWYPPAGCIPPPPPPPCAEIETQAQCTAPRCYWNNSTHSCSPPPPPPAPPYDGLNYTCGGPWEAGHCYAPCESPKYKDLPFCDRSLDLDKRVADAVSRLSLGEKISNTMASASNGWSEHGGFPSIGMPQQTTSEALHGVSMQQTARPRLLLLIPSFG